MSVTGSEMTLHQGHGGLFLFNLAERNEMAQSIIGDYALGHAVVDVGIGLAGLLVPGGGFAALVASIAGQAPLVYQPMAKRLAAVYSVGPDKVTNQMVLETAALGGVADLGAAVGAELIAELAYELMHELGIGLGISFIPLIGGVLAAGFDATIASTLTWRVGTMISMYHQNGDAWIGDRKTTYARAKSMVGDLSPVPTGRVNLNDVASKNQEIRGKQLEYIRTIVDMLTSFTSDKEQIRTELLKKKLPTLLIDYALKNFV